MQPVAEFIILADRAEVLQDKLYMMGGAWSEIGVHDFAAPVPVGVAVSIQVPWNATTKQHTWAIAMQTADGETVAGVDGTFAVGRPPLIEEGTSQRALLAFTLPVLLPAAGSYAVVVSVNGQESNRVRFRAHQAQPGPSA
jgi:hypothetical protein